ncbi:hypothetical protein B4100_3852 [Heyndrickxia coagulans]|nr:hypothetical protein B4100_3852 [Heyndrickxia coagulans]
MRGSGLYPKLSIGVSSRRIIKPAGFCAAKNSAASAAGATTDKSSASASSQSPVWTSVNS